jgi:hypothetical protein
MQMRDRPSPLTPRFENLASITAQDALLAYLATSKTKYCQISKIYKALSAFLDFSPASRALDALTARGLVAIPARTRCVLTEAGRAAAAARFGDWTGQGWTLLSAVALPALALGLDPKGAAARDYLSRKENMESLALGRVYGFVAAGSAPSRARTRALLLRVLLAARFPECAAALENVEVDGYKPDALAKALLFGLAGTKQGSLKDAESAITLQALGVAPGDRIELSEAILRAALSGGAAALQQESSAPQTRPVLPAFAEAVRDLAQTMETLPFTGRVAIAEVYDAGLARGFAFGTLEEFKTRVAEACRAGLIDLERYDIAGALDPTVRDRSRTPLGRDERHFIVNEWV